MGCLAERTNRMGKRDQEDERRQEEAHRILERVTRDSEPLVMRTAVKARDHLTAREARDMDPTELWGRRIGRALAVFFATGLIIWLVGYYFMGAFR